MRKLFLWLFPVRKKIPSCGRIKSIMNEQIFSLSNSRIHAKNQSNLQSLWAIENG